MGCGLGSRGEGGGRPAGMGSRTTGLPRLHSSAQSGTCMAWGPTVGLAGRWSVPDTAQLSGREALEAKSNPGLRECTPCYLCLDPAASS